MSTKQNHTFMNMVYYLKDSDVLTISTTNAERLQIVTSAKSEQHSEWTSLQIE